MVCRWRHVQAYWALYEADDVEILEFAARELRIIISSDTDFGSLLAASRSPRPSVVLTRDVSTMPTAELAGLLLANPLPWPSGCRQEQLSRSRRSGSGSGNCRCLSPPVATEKRSRRRERRARESLTAQ
ncbi:DUF5615 family PIN-like protein [Sporichthya sp.]|uniref:DUF5615 family PIN-like protein n=1 Tax=Sporichthya sp. TaxID=65475 RepID=UPI00345B6568